MPQVNTIHGVAGVETVLAIAKRYPVFPCGPDKRPRVRTGFHAATQDEAQIRAWWRQWPDSLVGVPTGQGTGLVVIDYDPDKANSATHNWIAEHTDLLLSTRVHKTPRGGLHYVFTSRERYQTGTDLVLDGSPRKGIDLRAAGGYVIWWPAHTGERPDTQPATLPSGLIDERRFDKERDLAPLPKATPEEWRRERQRVLEALQFVSPNGYEQWIAMGMAIHSASNGSDDGFGIWHDWSAQGESYDGIEDCRYHWASFGRYDGRKRGLGTLYSAAKAGGFVPFTVPEFPPVESYANDHGTPSPSLGDQKGDKGDTPEKPKIAATPWQWVNPKEIPPRPWVMGHHLMRGMISATAGIPGAGKSTVTLTDAISIAIGRNLLTGDELPLGPSPAWVHNGEDPQDELNRRVAAILQHFKVSPADIGDRLRITSGRTMPILVAQELSAGGRVFVPTDDGRQLADELRREGIVAFFGDPFVTLHRVSENDNVMIDAVLAIFRRIASEAGTAIDLSHHTRKLNGQTPGVDDLRGASSLIGACRSVRIIAPMSTDEAERAGVPSDERRSYVWLQNAKANMSPPITSRSWLKLVGENLGNASKPYGDDWVGVATPWAPPMSGVSINATEFAAIRRAVLAVEQPLNKLRVDVRSSRWIGALLAEVLELDITDRSVRDSLRDLISRLEKDGRLVRTTLKDPRQARATEVYGWRDEPAAEVDL